MLHCMLGHQVILFSSYCNESTVNAVQYTKNISLAIHNVTTMVILPWFQLLPTMTAPTTLKYLIVNYQGTSNLSPLCVFFISI